MSSSDNDPNSRLHASSGDASSGDEPKQRNVVEWTVTLLGAALVLGIAGYLVYEWVAGASGPAELVITTGPPTDGGGAVEIPIEVVNQGARVAEAAIVEVCAGPESCSEIQFDYVPFQSTVRGVVGLEAPLTAPVTARVVSFRKP